MKIINYLFLLLFIFNSVCLNNVQAQTYNSNSCINRLQLNNMQKLSLEEISKFLYDNSWTFNGAKTNQLYTYFKYDLNYSIVMWNKMYSNNENLLIYTADGKPNIVIYETNYSCFEELLKTYNQNNKSKILINDNDVKKLENLSMAFLHEFDLEIDDDREPDYDAKTAQEIAHEQVEIYRTLK